MKHTFKHTHLSSRYDRPVATLEKVVKGYTETSDIITLTEVDSERREKVLRDIPEWGFVSGDKTGRDDCAILWDSFVWKVLFKETYNVESYMAGNIGAATVVLEHNKTGKVVLFSVIHLPSSVEGRGRVSGGRADDWHSAQKLWKARCKTLAKRYNTQRMVLTADWNLNLKAKWVGRLIKTRFYGWRFVWDVSDLPAGGTHGSRLIDFTLIHGDVGVARRPRIHRSHPVSDHKGYDEILSL